jgi:hypothetical protein
MLMESEELSSWSLHSRRRVHLLFKPSYRFPNNKHSCPYQLACWLSFIPVVVSIQQFAFEHYHCGSTWNGYEKFIFWYLAESDVANPPGGLILSLSFSCFNDE